MPQFYEVFQKNSLKLFPKAIEIEAGLKRIDYCKREEAFYWVPFEEVSLRINNLNIKLWPDHLHDYHWENYYIFSENTFQKMEDAFGLKNIKSYPVKIISDFHSDTNHLSNPDYYLLNEIAIIGGNIDYKKSGLTYTVCKECRSIRINTEDIIKAIEQGIGSKLIIDESSWNGQSLFTIGDEKSTRLCCTDEFIRFTSEYHLTNFVFRNLETDKIKYGYR
ncbi:MAG: hypothetical protein ABUK01_19135 [Leptospirales bacterium]